MSFFPFLYQLVLNVAIPYNEFGLPLEILGFQNVLESQSGFTTTIRELMMVFRLFWVLFEYIIISSTLDASLLARPVLLAFFINVVEQRPHLLWIRLGLLSEARLERRSIWRVVRSFEF